MKNNNKGFVSLTIIYAFMILFLLILLSIVSFYVSNRIILKKSRDTAKSIMVDRLEKKSNKGYQVKIEYEKCDNPTISEGYHQWCNFNQLSCIVAKEFNPNNISNSEVMLHNAIILNEDDSCAVLDANDNSYRYVSKDTMNNYVCFGYDLGLVNDNTECPPDNLYQIIGIFKNQFGTYETKIIKANYATRKELEASHNGNQTTTYSWGSPNWKISPFNTKNLNDNFMNSLKPNGIPYWTNMIVNHEWSLIIARNSYTAKQNHDLVGDTTNKYTAYISLMDIIDYGYANPINLWGSPLTSSSTSNWLNLRSDEMTMSSDNSNVFYITASGSVGSKSYTSDFKARPVFYLRNSVRITTGKGTIENPYRLGV